MFLYGFRPNRRLFILCGFRFTVSLSVVVNLWDCLVGRSRGLIRRSISCAAFDCWDQLGIISSIGKSECESQVRLLPVLMNIRPVFSPSRLQDAIDRQRDFKIYRLWNEWINEQSGTSLHVLCACYFTSSKDRSSLDQLLGCDVKRICAIFKKGFISIQMYPSIHPSIHPSILGLSALWCPMSPHFLTGWVSSLLGLALVSWATALVGVHCLSLHLDGWMHCAMLLFN